MERRARSDAYQPVLLGVFLAAMIVLLGALFASIAVNGDWGMGGHMRGMMGSGTNTSNAAVTTGGKTEAVAIRDFAFDPGNLQVPAGATVTFTNYDSAPHTATAKDGGWGTGTLEKGDSRAITFDKPGDYLYYCKIHPSMVARLQVR